jgi:hypothetical protein
MRQLFEPTWKKILLAVVIVVIFQLIFMVYTINFSSVKNVHVNAMCDPKLSPTEMENCLHSINEENLRLRLESFWFIFYIEIIPSLIIAYLISCYIFNKK